MGNSSVNEQADRLAGPEALPAPGTLLCRGESQGRDAIQVLASNPQRLAAGRKQADFTAGTQDGICQAYASARHMLAVVEDKQKLFRAECPDEGVEGWTMQA